MVNELEMPSGPKRSRSSNGHAVAAELVRRHLCLTEVLTYPRSACISKERVRHVIPHYGLAFEEPAPQASEAADDRLVVLGEMPTARSSR
jgi:hypothetical protein